MIIKHLQGKTIIWLYNVEVKETWGGEKRGIPKKPRMTINNGIEETAMLLTRKGDYLILRQQPDPHFLKDLSKNGFHVPNILCPAVKDETKGISQLVLEDNDLMQKIKQIVEKHGADNVYLLPSCYTFWENQIAQICGMRMAFSSEAVGRQLHSKIFCAELADDLSTNRPQGFICNTLLEVCKAYYELHKQFSRVVIKEPYGAFGRGLHVVEDEEHLYLILKILNRKKGIGAFLVEGWYEDKIADISYQIGVCEDGQIDLILLAHLKIDNPSRREIYLGDKLIKEYEGQFLLLARALGHNLRRRGFCGYACVDSIIMPKETKASHGNLDHIFPMLEIIPCLDSTSYLWGIQNKYPGRVICGTSITLKVSGYRGYLSWRKKLKELGVFFNPHKGEGIMICVAATLEREYMKKLYLAVVGRDEEEVEHYKEVAQVLWETD